MNPRVLINLLVAIILSFTIKGFVALDSVSRSVQMSQAQQRSTTEDIGKVFDWYGLIVVDTTVKYCHGLITEEELRSVLKEGLENKNHLLSLYYSEATEGEECQVRELKKQDVVVDRFVEGLLESETLDPHEAAGVLREMYEVTAPAVETVNEIMAQKTVYTDGLNSGVHQRVKEFERVLAMSGVLAFAIGVSGNLPRHPSRRAS